MKKIYFLIFIIFCSYSGFSQIINFGEENLKAMLLSANTTNYVAYKVVNGNTQYVKIDTNDDGEIQVSEALIINGLRIINCNISSLQGIEGFANLQYILLSVNGLTNIDGLNNLTLLKGITCENNLLSGNLTVSQFPNLEYFDCTNNDISQIQIQNAPNFMRLNCSSNNINNLNVTNLSNLQYLFCAENNISMLNLAGLSNLKSLDCAANDLNELDVSSCLNLESLNCSENTLNGLTVNNLTALKKLFCRSCGLTSLNVSSLINLTNLECNNNQLNVLNVSNCINLKSLACVNTNLSSLDLFNQVLLKNLSCSQNHLTSLIINSGVNFETLDCSHNMISSLDMGNFPKLESLNCGYNQIGTLNVSNSPLLYSLICINNQLTSLFIKNGSMESTILYFYNNPNLEYICADENQIGQVQNFINQSGLTNCFVNSYCSFTPGGTFYQINGNSRYDSDLNGCTANDVNYERMKFSFVNEPNTGNLIADDSGHYSFSVQAGNHTVTPLLENPGYFNVFPSSVNVSFPSQASPSIQNFCISPNGTYSDLEISLIPLSAARPGFDITYKIIYKNKGTHTQSGSINMSFDDTILDVIDANPDTVGPSPESLVWTFADLHPFESRVIYITINLNSPVETPPVNGGDILHYTAAISSSQTDETPLDNTFTLNQTVVNSFDPNDKTCLEGNTITPEMIGNYVHYMIRFENTGTANAQNIVVKDIIDTSKFDVSSLIPLDGSHPFITRITDTNKVEFIFENIQLPFDDANNDGYVAFKIKTKPTLVIGNTFSNTASIYFDYNAPIVTNTATTAIQVLGTDDFDFNERFTLYPNPVNDILNIKSKDNTVIHSILVYNTLGQLILTVASPMESINVSELTVGNYIVRIVSDSGKASSKFIKK